MNTTSLKVIFGGMSLIMTCLAIFASLKSDMFHLPAAVVNEPWCQVTLVDFYFNITIISSWMIYREANLLRSLLWLVAFICLGSIATGFYVFLQFLQLKQGQGIEAVLLCRKTS